MGARSIKQSVYEEKAARRNRRNRRSPKRRSSSGPIAADAIAGASASRSEVRSTASPNATVDLHEERLRPLDRPAQRVRLLTKSDNIASYAFNTETARHLFCPNCGVASFYIPRSDPEAFDINVRCSKGVNLNKLEYDYFDGRNWEKAFHERQQARGAQ